MYPTLDPLWIEVLSMVNCFQLFAEVGNPNRGWWWCLRDSGWSNTFQDSCFSQKKSKVSNRDFCRWFFVHPLKNFKGPQSPYSSKINESNLQINLALVGGWTTPIEKYGRRIRSFPQVGRGENNQKIFELPPFSEQHEWCCFYNLNLEKIPPNTVPFGQPRGCQIPCNTKSPNPSSSELRQPENPSKIATKSPSLKSKNGNLYAQNGLASPFHLWRPNDPKKKKHRVPFMYTNWIKLVFQENVQQPFDSYSSQCETPKKGHG